MCGRLRIVVIRVAVLVGICLFTFLSSSTVYGAASTWPAPIPLFHKSPYFNAWIDAGRNATSLVYASPKFFSGKGLYWFIGIRVDNTSYIIQGELDFGVNYTKGTVVSAYIMATQTRFTVAAGPVLVNLTYLSPVELQDWTLHSFPFAYATFDIISSDGKPHAIQLYADTTLQLVSSADSAWVAWNTSLTDSSKSIYHMAQRRILQSLTENNDMSEDGTQILAYSKTSRVSMTWQTCLAEICRGNFTLRGKLVNTSDTNFRMISNRWPVLAYALDLGNITKTSNTLVFGIGLIRDPVVSYRTANTTQNLHHLWHSRWGDIGSAIDDFLTSYPSASSRANVLDDNIQRNATALASQLRMSTSTATKMVDLHILSLRQTVGSLEFTTSRRGVPVEMDDVRVFMKDVGYSRRTNPVEIMYASFPAFLFLNATVAGKLLEPLLEFQASSLYNNNYAAPDLGNSWPVIRGNTSDQSSLALDSCGAMLVMALAHAQKSGDRTLLIKYYDLLRKWADYLVQSTKQPNLYMSSDGLDSSNTNLALKGIMGLYAMGQVNKILGAGADPSNNSYYSDRATSYVQAWLNQAISSDHIMAAYGSNSTWAMIYNLFAARLLGAAIIPEQIYETQATWYANLNGSAAAFGLPFDGTQFLAKAHWTLLSASSVFNATSSSGRDSLINMVHSRSFLQSGSSPNPVSYSPIDGTLPGGSASPAMGAIYSLLALSLRDLTTTEPSGSFHKSRPKPLVIIGATLGGLGGLLLFSAVIFFLRRRRRQNATQIGGPLEELHARQRGPSTIIQFTGKENPPVTNNSVSSMPTVNIPPRILQPTKLVSPPSTGQTASVMTSGVSSPRSPGDSSRGEGSGTLRQEVEQLRRVVETLSAQQAQPQGYHQNDEPPPMYPNS